MKKLNSKTVALFTAAVAASFISISTLRSSGMFNSNELSSGGKVILGPSSPPSASMPLVSKLENKRKIIKSLKLNPSRTLYLTSEVTALTEELAPKIVKLSRQSKEPIVLVIDSPGGSVFSGEKVVSAIEAATSDVYTVCVGVCASMAAIIHQYGTKRLATDRSILMFHDAAGMAVGRVGEMLSLLSMIKRKLEKTNQYIASRSKVTYEELVALGANNFWIDAEDSLNRGLVDDLVVLEE